MASPADTGPARPEPARPSAALTGGTARRSAQLLWRGLRAESGAATVAVVASSVYGATIVGTSWLLGRVTDAVVVPALRGDEASTGDIAGGGAALAAVAVVAAVSVALRRVYAGRVVAGLQARHRRAVTRQYLRLPLAWHRQHPAGQLLSNAYSDAEAATGVFNPLPYAIGVVVMLVIATVALVAADGWIAAAALTVVPAVLVVNAVYQRYASPAATRAQQLRGEVSDVAHESFEAALLVKSLGTQDREEARFAERARALRDANVRAGTVRAVFDPLMDLLPNLGTLLVLAVGTWRLSEGAVEAGDVVAAAFLLSLVTVPVRAFGWVLGELPRGLVGYDRVARVIDARGELTAGERELPDPRAGAAGAAATGPGPGAHLRLEGVDVVAPGSAGPVHLLRGVDLEVTPGRVVALVGSTGAGKSTLAGLTARLADPAAGRVLLDGHDLRALAPASLAGAVALVSQDTFIFEDSVRANVTLADDDEPGAPDDDAVWEALRAARVDDVVGALPGGLDAPLGERGADLSGGQRQRLAVARALVRRPRLLVLDDATSAVDPRVEREILAGLRRPGPGAASGPSVLLIAYRLASIALADEVVHLERGTVVDRGTHAELLARDPGYAALATAYEQESRRRADAAEGSLR